MTPNQELNENAALLEPEILELEGIEEIGETEEVKEIKKPKRFRRTKKVLLCLLILIGARLTYFYSFDRPLASSVDAMRIGDPTADVPDAPFVENYNALQTREILPAAENGWRDLLLALGPKCLEQQRIADQVPWREIATNDLSKDWFKNEWTPLCEKFDLDPIVKPTAYDRLPLWQYMVKNGIVGDETPTGEGDGFAYWENGEKKSGRVSIVAANDAYQKLMGEPWTEKDYPVAAKWLEENEDLYALVADAARKPKFASWHFIADDPFATLLPDVQYKRELARLFQIRSRYRLGKGDVSGALDDVETILRIADSNFNREGANVVENLVGLAILGIALGAPYGEANPTPEECRRANALAAKYADDAFLADVLDRCMRAEKAFSLNSYRAMLTARRKSAVDDDLFAALFTDESEQSDASDVPVGWKLLRRLRPLWATPFNDEKALRAFNDAWNELAQASPEQRKALSDDVADSLRFSPWKWLTVSDVESAKIFARLITPQILAVRKAFQRAACVAKSSQIAAALLEYQTEEGRLPPAFSVDANGAPLMSWRVLILPYLGDEEKALYEKLALDEPWNSTRNKPLLAIAPSVFRCPSCRYDDPALTCFATLVGNDGFFDASGVGKDLTSFLADESADAFERALLVERDTPTIWSAPDSNLSYDQLCARYDAGGPLGGDGFLSSVHTTGSQIACANGGVHFHTTNMRAVKFDEESQILLFGKINETPKEQNADQPDASEQKDATDDDHDSTANADVDPAPAA